MSFSIAVPLFYVVLWIASKKSDAFQTFSVSTSSERLIRFPTELSVSFSQTSGGNATEFSDSDSGKNADRKMSRAPIQILSMDKIVQSTDGDPHFNEFHQYLKRLSLRIRNGERRAALMDNELKRQETKYFRLSDDDPLQIGYKASDRPYDGPTFRPDAKAYSMVINAYTKSGLGTAAARLAEEAAARYEKFNPGLQTNAFMIRGIVKAWLIAGNTSNAEEWINKMEDNYAITRSPDDAPDAATYTLFLESLSNSLEDSTPGAGDISMKILRKMRMIYLSEEHLQIMPTNETYQAVMTCQQKSHRGMIAVNKMYAVLKQQAEEYEEFGRPQSCKPSASCAMPLIALASEKRGNLEAIRIMEECIDELQARFEETGDPDYKPLDQMFTLLFSAYSRVNFKDSQGLCEKVDGYLATMARNMMKPSIYATTAAIRTKVNDRSDRRLNEAEEMMRALEEPDAFVYQSLLNGYCRNRNAEKADQLLQQLDESFGADLISMGACISAWAQTTTVSDRALERSERTLDAIVGRYRSGLVGPKERQVDGWVFEGVARLWLRSRKPECAERIVALIEDMECLSKHTPGCFLPSQTLYLLAFDALGVSGDGDGRRALKLFDAYEGLSKDGLLPAPSVRLLSAVLVSLVRSPSQPLHEDAIAIYYRILHQFGEGKSTERMDSRTLTTLIRSILGSSKEDARDLAMQVLDRTIAVARRSPDVVKLNKIAMNMILDGFAAKGFPDEAWSTFNLMSSLTDEGFETFPDVTSYTSLAKALAAARTPRTMERLDVLVEQVMGMYEKGSLFPDIQLFDNVLIGYRNVWSLHIEASRRAYDLLTWLESLRGTDDKLAPGLGSYRAVCEALAKSKVSNSLKMLEDVYQRARDLSKDGIIDELDRELCYAVISGYARQHDNRSIEKAEEIIADMELLREQDKHSAGAPDVRVYNRLLFAYSSVDVVDLATRAFTLFSRMKNAYEQGSTSCKPNTHSYNALILAAAKSNPSNNMRTFNIAVGAFKSLHSSTDRPNSASYEYFLRACSRLIPDGVSQTEWTHRVFLVCRRRGLVTPLIIRLVCCFLPEIIEELEKAPRFGTMGDRKLSGRPPNVYIIPASWCSATPAKDRRQRVEIGDVIQTRGDFTIQRNRLRRDHV